MIARSAERPRGAREVAGNYEYVRKVRASARGPRVSALVNITIARPNSIPTRVVNWALANDLGCIRHVQVVHLPGSCAFVLGLSGTPRYWILLRSRSVVPLQAVRPIFCLNLLMRVDLTASWLVAPTVLAMLSSLDPTSAHMLRNSLTT